VSASARLDVHNEYGVLLSPRVSLLTRPAEGWTLRVSAGGGSFTPTPFTEETDEAGLSHLAPLSDLRAERAWGASADASWSRGPLETTATVFASRIQNPVQLAYLQPLSDLPYTVMLRNAPQPTNTWGTEFLLRLRRAPFIAMATHAFTHSTEFDVNERRRRDVPLTPRQTASFNVMWEDEEIGRAGFELYFIGAQPLDENPYRARGQRHVLWGGLVERRVGPMRLFLNIENVGDVRQTKFDPLLRPQPLPDGRRTVDAWAPLDGRVLNGGVRFGF
jgi:outer membrane receptor for ferrienterochelin and colicins